VDVRAGIVTRDEALKWVEKFDSRYPEWYAGVDVYDMLDRIGMTRAQLDETLKRFTNTEIHAG
jgi:hypothetical protein